MLGDSDADEVVSDNAVDGRASRCANKQMSPVYGKMKITPAENRKVRGTQGGRDFDIALGRTHVPLR